ncbi:hypothetical protein EDC04DRAFT_286828 [Pisolithus marmoratus]|nr:hypothetical protein EDC04DRAFT_286828 [Pisolithus marmoratus]
MLFECTMPELRVGNGSLQTIPVEIYLEIVGHLAPPGEKLSRQQTKTLTRFASACRLFCHIALPRIHERVDFVGHMNCRDDNLSSRETSWNDRIAAGEDLALWGAKCVKECHFRGLLSKLGLSWSVSLFIGCYAVSLGHMTHISRLTFARCLITDEYWRAIMALGALEELWIDQCECEREYTEISQPTQSSHPLKIRVPSFQFYEGYDGGDSASVTAELLDLGRLRFLKADIEFVELLNWPQDCILEQLHISRIDYASSEHQAILKPILRQAGQRMAELKLTFWERVFLPDYGNHLQNTLPDNVQNLRSLILVIDAMTRDHVNPREMSSLVCRCVGFSPTMERLVIKSLISSVPAWWRGTGQSRLAPSKPPPFDHVQDITLSTISPVFPKISYVEIYGTALHLKDGSWVKVRAA